MKKELKILAIESSCDETAAAVIGEKNNRPVILSNVVSSQIDLHAKTGGVVPEVASRAHMEAIMPVITEALLMSAVGRRAPGERQSNSKHQTPNYHQAIELLDDITHIAVTAGPGLVGSLLVGFSAAKAIAFARDLPIIPINHIEGHIYSAFSRVDSLEYRVKGLGGKTLNTKLSTLNKLKFPILALTVSGGHTSLTLMKDHGVYEQIGATVDDAVGEAYDKVAKLMGLGYPGGPQIAKLAKQFRDKFLISNSKFLIKSQTPNPKPNDLPIIFPRPMIESGDFNFSFSGLKTAVLIWVKKYLVQNGISNPNEIPLEIKEEIAAAFEEAVKDVLVAKTLKAIRKYSPASVIFAGGVSANGFLRNSLESRISNLELGTEFITPQKGLYGDNAAMIGLAAYYHIQNGDTQTWQSAGLDANLKLNS